MAAMTAGVGGVGGVAGGAGVGGTRTGSGHGSLGSHGSNQEVYVNIYQNTNHPSLFVSLHGALTHSLFSAC
jgi:hypothetical protein